MRLARPSCGPVSRPGSATEKQYKYDAFISYSSAIHGQLAKRLQHRLERFATPWYRPRAMRVFRDYTNLVSSDNLARSIEQALQNSRWLILIASPEAAMSSWVNREVEWWRDNRTSEHVCLVLAAGSLRWDDKSGDWDRKQSTALPPSAYGMFTAPPRWVNLTSVKSALELDRANPTLQECVAEIVAPIRGWDKDNLVGEHITLYRRARRQLRSGIAGLAVLTVASMVATAVAVAQASIADRERREALAQRDIATSRQLAANAELKTRSDPQLAALLSVAAMDIRDTPEARAAMVHQLAALRHGTVAVERYLSNRPGAIFDISTSDRDKVLAIAGEETSLWNWESGTRLKEIPISASHVEFAPGGDVLALSGENRVVLWDVAQNHELSTFPTGESGAPVAFSPDGLRLAIGGIDFTAIQIWDTTSMELQRTLAFPKTGNIPQGIGNRAVEFSPDGSLIIADGTIDREPGVTVWDANTGVALKSIGNTGDDPCVPFSLAFSPDQELIAAGCAVHSAAIAIWNVASGAETARLHAEGDVNSIAFSSDGETLVSADSGHIVSLWDTATHTRTTTLRAHTREVYAVAFTPSDEALVSGSADGNAIVWDWNGGDPLPAVQIPETQPPSSDQLTAMVAFDAETRAIAYSVGEDLITWNTESRRIEWQLTKTGIPISYLPGNSILTIKGGTFAIWGVKDGRQRLMLDIPEFGDPSERPFAVSLDRTLVATPVGDGRQIVLWDIRANKKRMEFPATNVSSLSIGPHNDLLAVGEAKGSVTLWSIADQTQRATLPIETNGGAIVTVLFSSDGTTLAALAPAGQPQTASGCRGCTITLWNTHTFEKVAELVGHKNKPYYIAFSSDGRMLASAGWNEMILWSVSQRAALVTLPASGPLSFSANGRWLATRRDIDDSHSRITLWDVDPESWSSALCQIAGRTMTADEWKSYLPERVPISVCR
ncbi:MAG: TIR domain-containing protein [Micromonosporaceae bacterium]|nr:TIR domain-containing protein [Micromonosporaceae bacterium]